MVVCALGCGSGDGTDVTGVPTLQELRGTYDTRATLDDAEIASTATQVGVGFDDIVILDLATGALDRIHLQGVLETDGSLRVTGNEVHPDRVLSVTGTLRAFATPHFHRIEGTIGTIAGFVELSMVRPATSPADRPQGPFVLTFEPSIAGSGPSSHVAATIDVSELGCSVMGGPEVPDRVGGVLFGGTCALAPNGAFSLHTRFRTVTPDTSPFGEDFQLVGTLRTTPAGIVGSGQFGLERFPPNADVFGTWRASRD